MRLWCVALATALFALVAWPEVAAAAADLGARPAFGSVVQPAVPVVRPRAAAAPAQAAAAAPADAAAPDSGAGGGGVLVGAIVVAGADPLPQTAFLPAIGRYIGRTLSPGELAALASAVAAIARDHGYVFARARVDGQTVQAGVLTVSLDLGRVDRVVLNGANSAAARAILAHLIGHPLLRAELERRIALVNDLPAIRLDQVRFAVIDGAGVLSATVVRKSLSIAATLDNRGQSGVGPVRLGLAYAVDGLLGDDRLSLSGGVLVTPLSLPQQTVAGARLAYVLDDAGSELAVSGTTSRVHPGGALLAYDLGSASHSVDVTYARPLLRRRGASVWMQARAAFVDESQWAQGALSEHDRTLALSLSTWGFTGFAGGTLRGGLAVTRLAALDAAFGMPSPDGATFAGAWFNWQRDWGARFGLRLAMTGQLSTGPLPLVDQLTLGGPAFGRAYDIGERIGDEGALALAEAQINTITHPYGALSAAQVFGFVDGGVVTLLGPAHASGALASAGMGSRLRFGEHVALEFEAAWPINQPRQANGTYAPRLSTSLGTTF